MATARNRRDALRLALAGIGAAVLGMQLRDDAGAAEVEGIPIYHCKVPGERCQGDGACCSGKCKKRVCTCRGKGSACFEPLRGSICCSGKCKNGQCK